MEFVQVPANEWREMKTLLSRIDQKLSRVDLKTSNWITESEAVALTGKSKETLRKMRNGRRNKGELVTPPMIHRTRNLNGRDIQYWRPELEALFSAS